jgi:arylsulfatase A-like enzyme
LIRINGAMRFSCHFRIVERLWWPLPNTECENLAAGGLKYNRFHTTALCSPTRAALLTGRNHHSTGMGGITEIATGAPGYSSVLPNTI